MAQNPISAHLMNGYAIFNFNISSEYQRLWDLVFEVNWSNFLSLVNSDFTSYPLVARTTKLANVYIYII